ncbi:hypothetical protein CK203_069180 [Vitis vinifera]|uniref:Uncharacterized protein n=1 Tax=Vitis vinifera TaxID=29760 RepID=A0A438C2U6_VITVI|nr:hypothetical protein CK203_069180 [Vitis vinifera]
MLLKIMQINKCLTSIGVEAIFQGNINNLLPFWLTQDYAFSGLMIDNVAFVMELVSNTQTHQIAARKEKQMETLRAALGISMPEVDVQKQDKVLDSGTEEGDHEERQTTKRKQQDSKKRRDGDDPSDTDSGGKHGKAIKKSYIRSGSVDDSDVDTENKKNLKSEKTEDIRVVPLMILILTLTVKSKRHDSDDSGSDDDFDVRSSKKEAEKHVKAHKRHDSDDSYSDDAEQRETVLIREDHKKTDKRHGSGGRYVAYSDSDSDRAKIHQKENIETNDRHGSGGRYVAYSDSGSDKAKKHTKESIEQNRKNRKHGVGRDDSSEKRIGKSRRHDSDEDSSDRDDRYDGKITKRKATEKDPESSTDDSDDSISDDSKEESSDSDSGSSSSDYKHERKDTNKSMRKSKSGDGADVNAKGERGAYGSDHRRKERSDLYNDDDGGLGALKNLENKLYQSRGNIMHGSGYGNQEITKGKRKLEDGQDEQPESKSRNRNSGKEVMQKREHRKETKVEFKSNSRPNKSKDDQKREDVSRLTRSGGGNYQDDVKDGGRIRGKDDEPWHGSRRNDRDHENHGGKRKHGRDEEEDRRRTHNRDEKRLEYRRHEKDEEERQHAGRRHEKDEEERQHAGRRHRSEEEERQASRRNESDERMYSSKRGRDDDSRSSKRRSFLNLVGVDLSVTVLKLAKAELMQCEAE